MSINHAIEVELAVREAAKKDMLLFAQYTKTNYRVNWHHRVICDVLNKINSGDLKKVMIFLPPQTGKSELATRRLIPYMIGNNPNRRIIVATYSQEYASKFNRDIQRIIESVEYQNIFPDITLGKKGSEWVRNSVEMDIVGFDGNIKTVGVGGGITGNPIDFGNIDDPLKGAEHANSRKYRDSLWEWYLREFKTRLHNESQQLLTVTRWHEDDLAGRILEIEGDEWEIVKIPAISRGIKTIYDNREIGEVLWEDMHSLERMQEIERNTPSVFMSMYQQEPTAEEGEILKKEHFKVWGKNELPNEVFTATRHAIADTAYTAKSQNDPSAVIVYSVLNNEVYIHEYIEMRLELSMLLKKIVQIIKPHFSNRSVLYVEPKASGQDVISMIRKETLINVQEHKNLAVDKIVRVWAAEPILASGRVNLIDGNWVNKFINDCAAYPKIKHDEAPDLLSMVISRGLMINNKRKRHHRRGVVR